MMSRPMQNAQNKFLSICNIGPLCCSWASIHHFSVSHTKVKLELQHLIISSIYMKFCRCIINILFFKGQHKSIHAGNTVQKQYNCKTVKCLFFSCFSWFLSCKKTTSLQIFFITISFIHIISSQSL